jgi:two-component system response regulator (stage 0 sporulation protein F)
MTDTTTELHVLVVDDEGLIRWAIRETLAAAGHSIEEAENGATALKSLARTSYPFDVILLDYDLPDVDDLSLLKLIRQRSPDSRVIMMTAYGTPEVVNIALDLGAIAVVGKPLDMAQLIPMIQPQKAAQSGHFC